MPELDSLLQKTIRGEFSEVLGTDNVFIEALRDILKDEVKNHIRRKLEENPPLRAEMKDAVGAYFEAKIREATAGLRLARLAAHLGVELLPDHLKREISQEIVDLVEDEVGRLLTKSV